MLGESRQGLSRFPCPTKHYPTGLNLSTGIGYEAPTCRGALLAAPGVHRATQARLGHLRALVSLMDDFYSEAGYTLNHAHAEHRSPPWLRMSVWVRLDYPCGTSRRGAHLFLLSDMPTALEKSEGDFDSRPHGNGTTALNAGTDFPTP